MKLNNIWGSVKNSLSYVQALDLSLTAYFCMGFTSMEIKTEIWISFSRFISGSCV